MNVYHVIYQCETEPGCFEDVVASTADNAVAAIVANDDDFQQVISITAIAQDVLVGS